MKPPRFLIGATLLFWGWQTGLLAWAAPMAVLAELHQLFSARWEFSIADLKRIWNLCILLALGEIVILYSSEDLGQIALKFTQWLPLALFPIALAQIYGTSEKIPLVVFSWFLRRSPESALAKKSIHISFLYFTLCLIAASATTQPNNFFYAGIALLISFALLANRPRRFSRSLWITTIAVIAVAGHVSHEPLRALHGQVEGTLARWLVSLFTRRYNFNESRTAIGRIGRIQLSGNIVMRVKPEENGLVPDYLREATYNNYHQGTWRGSEAEPAPVFVSTNDVAMLQTPKPLNFSVRIENYLSRGRGQIALPPGNFELDEFLAVLKTNRLGVARIESGPGLLNFVARYGPGKTWDGEPTEADLHVPRSERVTVQEVADQLNFTNKTDREKIEIIRHFFHDNFSYSLDITGNHIDPSGKKTPLGMFLTEARSGHCEYFGSAAVMLLRAAGIPARYATGYLVDESERKGNTYYVRERDGHAWALLYHRDRKIWENLDVTPESSNRAADFHASKWESVSDFFSDLKFRFSEWRWSKTHYTGYLKWLLIPLVLFLVWRILSARKRKNHRDDSQRELVWPGKDSEFYLLEQKMAEAGMGRGSNELLSDWRARLPSDKIECDALDRVFQLHHQLRFDPLGMSSDERRQLKVEVERCLKTLEKVREK
jgi:hypothetical protein